jgi:SAM-dependent methyltransferase
MAGRLQNHFSSSNTPDQWDALWKDSYAPWDRGQASPALFDLLSEREDLVGSTWAQPDSSGHCSKRRKRALVAGCGRGYEVLMLAQFGYDAYGLDGSETAIQEANKLVQEQFEQLPAEGHEGSKGRVSFMTGDFFRSDWLDTAGLAQEDTFDLIYDYTVYLVEPVLSLIDMLTMSVVFLCFAPINAPSNGETLFGTAFTIRIVNMSGVPVIQRAVSSRSSIRSSRGHICATLFLARSGPRLQRWVCCSKGGSQWGIAC